MLKASKVLPKNEHGYINGRGKSKYWGVTTAVDANGKDYWVVSFQAIDLDMTLTIRPSFKIKEEDAARVAAYVYEQGQKYATLQSDLILSTCGRYVLHINRTNRQIYKTPLKPGMEIYNQSRPSLDEFVTDSVVPVVKQTEEKKKVNKEAFDALLVLLSQMDFTQEQTIAIVGKLTSK